jgi:asparagine synthase (glutamine-hydrolysing)
MRAQLPPRILARKKIGFDIPAHEMLRGPLRPLLMDTLADAAAAHSDFFRFSFIQELVEAHQRRRANLGYHLWGLLTLFLWIKKWKIQTAPLTQAAQVPEKVLTSI